MQAQSPQEAFSARHEHPKRIS